MFVTHLDLLDDLDEIKVCTAYKTVRQPAEPSKEPVYERVKGRLPASIKEYSTWEAEFEILKGWKKETKQTKRFDDLPIEAQSLIKYIEKKTKKEVSFVSTSADLDEGMLRVRGP